jgi:VWFA-related protein
MKAASNAAMQIAILLAASCACAQGSSGSTTLQSTANLVLVPALVRDSAGDLVYGLHPEDFKVTDNGVEQKITIEQVERQPVAILVLMQIGGDATRQFANYRSISTMLDYLAGSSKHHAGIVTFDSAPEETWSFTSRNEELADAFLHPTSGDTGAAIYDAVMYGVDVLKQQPVPTRRIILLLSQPQDRGSKATAQQVVRTLGENNVTIFSVTFSPEKRWLKDQFTKPRHESPPYKFGYDHPDLLHTFDLTEPLMTAIRAMETDSAAEISDLSGGEHVRFDDKHSLEEQLGILTNHIPNRYALSFRPSQADPGFHTLTVEVVNREKTLSVAARSGYWSGAHLPEQ